MQGQRPDGHQGRIIVSVEPSLKLKPGVYFEVNDHYESMVEEKGLEADRMMEILASVWQASLERAAHITQTLMKTP